jgi:hypothetical protein
MANQGFCEAWRLITVDIGNFAAALNLTIHARYALSALRHGHKSKAWPL